MTISRYYSARTMYVGILAAGLIAVVQLSDDQTIVPRYDEVPLKMIQDSL